MDILSRIFNGILHIVFILVDALLYPIDLLIESYLPEINNGLEAVGDLLDLIASGIGWAISATGVPYFAIAMVATFYIFKLTIPINIWAVKLALAWYRTLKG